MQKNSNLIITIAVILVILGGVAFMLDSKKNQDKSSTQQGDSLNPADSNNVAYNNYTQDGVDETPEEELVPATPPSPSQGAPKPAARLTYDQALAVYGSGGNNYRFQFAANCQSTPSSLTLKKNSKFMLDNRDEVAHTFKIGSQTIRLNKYAFAVVTARQTGDLAILCDGVNRAKILVQQ
jgi:hypothetical protein